MHLQSVSGDRVEGSNPVVPEPHLSTAVLEREVFPTQTLVAAQIKVGRQRSYNWSYLSPTFNIVAVMLSRIIIRINYTVNHKKRDILF